MLILFFFFFFSYCVLGTIGLYRPQSPYGCAAAAAGTGRTFSLLSRDVRNEMSQSPIFIVWRDTKEKSPIEIYGENIKKQEEQERIWVIFYSARLV